MKPQNISVILAAYHGEMLIGEQLRSLFHQTCPPAEILIGDDSGDEKTAEAVRRVLPESPCPIRIFRNDPRKGCTANFSFLAENAAGDFIFFCDQDDIWLPGKIERMMQEFETEPETQVVFCCSRFVDQDLNDLGYSTADILNVTPEAEIKINREKDLRDFIRNPMMYGHNIAVRKEFSRCFLPIPARVTSYDLYLNYVSAAANQIRCVREDLTLFRRHDRNLSSQQSPFRRILNLLLKKENTELYETWNHLESAVRQLQENPAAEEIRKKETFLRLRRTRDFARNRLLCTAEPFYKRLRALRFLRDYLEYGSGLKSLCRDLVLKAKIPEQGKPFLKDQ